MAGLEPLRQGIDAVIDGALEAGRIVGAVVLVRENGVATYARAAGQGDREADIPTVINTVFRLASLTKPITAAAALALIEQGRLGLDDPAARYLSGFRPRLTDGTVPQIRVRHLLTHTAGFGYPSLSAGDPYRAAKVSTGGDQPGLSLQENLQRIASVPLYFAPGSAWRYGVATDVLGAVVAAVHGGPLADAVREYVTGPLGMADTAFTVREPARLAVPYVDGAPRARRMAEPQTIGELTFSPARAFDDRSFQSGGGGMVGTAGDFMAFLEVVRTGGTPILERGTVAMASTNQVADMRDAESPGWGFGFLSAVLLDPGASQSPQSAGTLSWGGLWGNSWFVDPSAGLSVVALTNTALEGCIGAFPDQVRDAVYAARRAPPVPASP